MRGEVKRILLVAHRRWGKDDVCLNLAARAAMKRKANYLHCLPEYEHARKVIWNAVNPHTGVKRIDQAFPECIRKRTDSQGMLIEFINGSTWQLVGSDRQSSIVGAAPYGITFSEFALADPMSWALARPILRENGGWAAFISTPRGPNHFAKMYEGAIGSPEWHVEISRADQTSVFDAAGLALERTEMHREWGESIGEALFQQEYMCSFDAPTVGAYYAGEISKMDAERRLTRVPWSSEHPVYMAADIGYRDATVIWFAQVINHELRIIDLYSGSGKNISEYAEVIKSKPYVYEAMYLPPDARGHRLATGKSVAEMLQDFGLPVEVLGSRDVQASIQQVRSALTACVIDRERCSIGIDALRQYRAKYDMARKVLSSTPLHDWTSDYADGFAYLILGLGSWLQDRISPVTVGHPYGGGRAYVGGRASGWMA